MQNYSPKISVIGLGYVGLPVAINLAAKFETVGFDIDPVRVDELRDGIDRTKECTREQLSGIDILFSANPDDLKDCQFHIVAVPTPIDGANTPDLRALLGASKTVGQALKKGDIVVFESTVYPGATEEECIPVLEKESGLVAGEDFKVGYSPERINPGDKEHTFTKIKKVVSAQDQDSLEKVSHVYGSVVEAGIFQAESIKVAEAAKIIENTQRDINIALMNELAMIFDKMDIDTFNVLEAASTKWNFLNFKPGLVGGHCIGVDPYYLTYKAQKLGHHPEVILSGRRINDSMGKFVAQKFVKAMVNEGLDPKKCMVTVYGLTFKENCPDLRNTKVIDVVRELASYGIECQITDPEASPEEAKQEYGLTLTPLKELKPSPAAILAVAHKEYKELTLDNMDHKIVLDVKGLFSKHSTQQVSLLSI